LLMSVYFVLLFNYDLLEYLALLTWFIFNYGDGIIVAI